ncbi:MAG: phosphoadenylyl-sulfate reductase [SAR86 cluster bacterium]|uniref:Adenosine 5'-phosphosulfate reductase n=1 Tax=SAR86 cluster bacterium TaxID=2030880 RepID=A0A2A5B3H0_9GAMM|nr:MAG: phosphoadenylyl-sulfate reductase [SAR86 cluster bacterium]
MMTEQDILEFNASLADSQPKEIIAAVIKEIPNFAISFSGAEDVVLIELTSKLLPDPPAVFTLDTGRLHPETYQFLELVRKHYSLPLETLHPDPKKLEKLIKNKGLYSFYEDGHEECCGIRKVEPLRAKLSTLDAWITGQRRDQSPLRSEVAIIEIDQSFSDDAHQLIKVNPLANWSSADVWEYIQMFDVPYNKLHNKGYISIGCEPCTRAVRPNQHEREGRWWWEEATIKECGLHISNLNNPNKSS